MAELHSIRDRIETLIQDVIEGRVERGKGAVVGQLYNTLIRAVSVELKAKEQEELIQRLEALEEQLESQDERRGFYGAS